jgi:hypothetical protein
MQSNIHGHCRCELSLLIKSYLTLDSMDNGLLQTTEVHFTSLKITCRPVYRSHTEGVHLITGRVLYDDSRIKNTELLRHRIIVGSWTPLQISGDNSQQQSSRSTKHEEVKLQNYVDFYNDVLTIIFSLYSFSRHLQYCDHISLVPKYLKPVDIAHW